PGNSHQPAMCLPAGRSAMSTRPCESNSAAATTRSRCFGTLLDPLEHTVAVLELLAAAARTGLVASHLRRDAHGALHGRRHLLLGKSACALGLARLGRRRIGRSQLRE